MHMQWWHALYDTNKLDRVNLARSPCLKLSQNPVENVDAKVHNTEIEELLKPDHSPRIHSDNFISLSAAMQPYKGYG